MPRNPKTDTFDIANAARQSRNQVVGPGVNTGLVTAGLLAAPAKGVAHQCPTG